ncbi:HesB/YadR/YfhF family protein [Desertibacillus haloalkaliphilus]|uniref:HesB/YadR/YfhF family protein n=1 Tax=Desertibacillus haloalkaliphilus TaxID=1328930 RepID=UPI001C272AB6|nr:HesB/YadR/YfhF family protein [Desertibacillus haloalkaliphilus]MBU8907402.1 HesB/YadR/YfhF family protein [Desertibacillus haloalkaliphilus]
MKITITEPALKWFEEEMDIEKGEFIRFFARYGGDSSVQQGFSLGVTKESPKEAAATLDVNGYTFFIESDDLWYFDNHDLHVKYSRKTNSITYDYQQ